MNLDYLREELVVERMKSWWLEGVTIPDHPLFMAAVDDWVRLPSKWNAVRDDQNFEEASVMHFSGKLKPWNVAVPEGEKWLQEKTTWAALRAGQF